MLRDVDEDASVGLQLFSNMAFIGGCGCGRGTVVGG